MDRDVQWLLVAGFRWPEARLGELDVVLGRQRRRIGHHDEGRMRLRVLKQLIARTEEGVTPVKRVDGRRTPLEPNPEPGPLGDALFGERAVRIHPARAVWS